MDLFEEQDRFLNATHSTPPRVASSLVPWISAGGKELSPGVRASLMSPPYPHTWHTPSCASTPRQALGPMNARV